MCVYLLVDKPCRTQDVLTEDGLQSWSLNLSIVLSGAGFHLLSSSSSAIQSICQRGQGGDICRRGDGDAKMTRHCSFQSSRVQVLGQKCRVNEQSRLQNANSSLINRQKHGVECAMLCIIYVYLFCYHLFGYNSACLWSHHSGISFGQVFSRLHCIFFQQLPQTHSIILLCRHLFFRCWENHKKPTVTDQLHIKNVGNKLFLCIYLFLLL